MDVDREDLVNMIKGSQPSFAAMETPPINNLVNYSDQYGRYYWDDIKLEKLSIESLKTVYFICKSKK